MSLKKWGMDMNMWNGKRIRLNPDGSVDIEELLKPEPKLVLGVSVDKKNTALLDIRDLSMKLNGVKINNVEVLGLDPLEIKIPAEIKIRDLDGEYYSLEEFFKYIDKMPRQ